MGRRRMWTVALISMAVGGALVPVSAAQAATCPPAQRTERGYCQPPLNLSRPSWVGGPTAREKDALATAMATRLRAGITHRVGASTILPHDPAPLPGTYEIPAVARMRIFKEGEGNGRKSYTCGPSTTRNMVAALWKTYYGYYKDVGEYWFEKREGTKAGIGTSTDAIAKVLNHYFNEFGSWKTYRPVDKYDYMARVRTNTATFQQPIPVAVDTEFYRYFQRKPLNHIHLVYGYDLTTSPWQVRIAEEWDPIFIYGHSDYGNPYGKRHPANYEAFNAVSHTSFHMMVV